MACQISKSGGVCESAPPPCGEGEVCDEALARCLRAGAPPALQKESSDEVPAGRSVAIVIPSPDGVPASRAAAANEETALRVRLSSLHHPSDPVPPNSPDFSGLEGEVRYVNVFRDSQTNEIIVDCPDSPSFGTSYKCATLGCTPEYLDWSTLFSGNPVFISASALVPDSAYDIAQLGLVCQGDEANCASASAELHVTTGRWGDANGSLAVNVTDVVAVVDRVKDVAGALSETQCYVRKQTPNPIDDAPNVTDIVLHVDALKLIAYPLGINPCP